MQQKHILGLCFIACVLSCHWDVLKLVQFEQRQITVGRGRRTDRGKFQLCGQTLKNTGLVFGLTTWDDYMAFAEEPQESEACLKDCKLSSLRKAKEPRIIFIGEN